MIRIGIPSNLKLLHISFFKYLRYWGGILLERFVHNLKVGGRVFIWDPNLILRRILSIIGAGFLWVTSASHLLKMLD